MLMIIGAISCVSVPWSHSPLIQFFVGLLLIFVDLEIKDARKIKTK